MLKIERENGSYDRIEFSFRYTKIESELKEKITERLEGYNFSVNKPKGKDWYVILIDDLNEEFNYELLKDINKDYSIDSSNYSIWVSFTSQYDHGGLIFPDFILEMYKAIGGKIEFSYIII